MSKGLTHEIIADIKKVAHTMGRTPSRNQYVIQGNFGKHQIDEVFGNWTNAIRAAGMSTKGNGKLKVDKQEVRQRVLEKLRIDVEKKKSLVLPPKISARHLFISDPHAPYSHPDRDAFLFALDDKYKFDRQTIGGDEIDGQGFSFHTHDPDLLSPGHELEAAINNLQPLYDRWPEMDILESNHGSLVYRKGKHYGLPRHVLKDYRDVIRAPEGWRWHEELMCQFSNGSKAIAHHGYSSNILQASQKRASSLIQFHFHSKFSINYWQNASGELFWCMQLSCLIDDTSAAFAYNKLTLERPIRGVGAVFDGLPRLLPMLLDKHGRWTGVVP